MTINASANVVRVYRSINKSDSSYIAEILASGRVFTGSSTNEVRNAALAFLDSTVSADTFDMGYLSKVSDYECKPAVLTVPAEVVAAPKFDGRKVPRTWVHDASGNASRVLESELQGYLDRGFLLGKKLESAKVTKPAKDADALHGNTGKVWYHNGSESVRLESFEIPGHIASGYVPGRGTLAPRTA